MIDFGDFERVFSPVDPIPYPDIFIDKAASNRRHLQGQLFIERALAALGIPHATKRYPPRSKAELAQLHKAICVSNRTPNIRNAVIYYLLLDIDQLSGYAQRAVARATLAGVPARYQASMRGLWHLDRLDFETALTDLTHPFVDVDFADEIVVALVRGAARARDYTLPLAYYHTVRPVLHSTQALEALVDALTHADVLEAVRFSRAQPELAREVLFRRVFATVLKEARSDAPALALAALPLDRSEEDWLETLLQEAGRRNAAARDMRLLRRVARGDPVDGIETGMWAPVVDGYRRGTGGRV